MTVPSKFSFLIASLLLWFGGEAAQAYDSPNLDFKIVDTDALMLPKNELESVVEALNAVACNFPDSPLIDDDLKEKALSLALALDPLNVNSRNAHHKLLNDRPPEKTAFFQSSVSEVAEKLWASASRMSGKNSEPESRKLALYLEELSLTLHPGPPIDRVKQFDRRVDGDDQNWGKFLKLQPKENPSGARLKKLFSDAKSNKPVKVAVVEKPPRKDKEAAAMPVKKEDTPKVPDKKPEPPKKTDDSLDVKISEVEIPFIAKISAPIRTGMISGVASLDVGKAGKSDESLFGVAPAVSEEQAYEMRLIPNPRGFQIEGLEEAESLIRQSYPKWPERKLAEVQFDTSQVPRSPRRLASADMSVAAGLLLEAAFSGKTLVDGIVYSGQVTTISDDGKASFALGDQLGEVLEQAREGDAGYILVPESEFDALVAGAISTRKLEYLFDPQIISYSSWDQLKDTAFGGGTEERAAASEEFKKIQAVQDQMSLIALSRNEKVRERLDQIIEKYPQHLSAKIMLAFGAAPDDPKALLQEAIQKVDIAVEPFIFKIAGAVDEGNPSTLSFEELKPILEESDRALLALQSQILPEVRNYLYQAKEVLNAVKNLASTSSNTSSIATQRFEAVKKTFGDLQLERTALGLDRIE